MRTCINLVESGTITSVTSYKAEVLCALLARTAYSMSSLGSACSPGAIAGRGFPPAQACAGSKRAVGAYHVDAKDELAIAVHGTPGDGTEVGSADLALATWTATVYLTEHLLGSATASILQRPSNGDRA